MIAVLVGKENLVLVELPIDVELRVVPGDCAFALRVVESVAFVLEDSIVTEDGEAVGETFGDKVLEVVVLGELDRMVVSKSRRVFADIYCDVEYASFDDADELALSEGRILEVEATEDASFGFGLIVLDELDVESCFLAKLAGVETFEEISPEITKDLGLDDEESGDIGC